jgi:hypothetical protein
MLTAEAGHGTLKWREQPTWSALSLQSRNVWSEVDAVCVQHFRVEGIGPARSCQILEPMCSVGNVVAEGGGTGCAIVSITMWEVVVNICFGVRRA